MRMSELLNEVRRFELDEGFSPREIKMAIGIASDPRYAKGNMTGAVKAIEKMKKGLSDHPQVAAVLKRQNEDLDEAMKGFKVEFGKGNDAGMAVYKDKKDAEAFYNMFEAEQQGEESENYLTDEAKKSIIT